MHWIFSGWPRLEEQAAIEAGLEGLILKRFEMRLKPCHWSTQKRYETVWRKQHARGPTLQNFGSLLQGASRNQASRSVEKHPFT